MAELPPSAGSRATTHSPAANDRRQDHEPTQNIQQDVGYFGAGDAADANAGTTTGAFSSTASGVPPAQTTEPTPTIPTINVPATGAEGSAAPAAPTQVSRDPRTLFLNQQPSAIRLRRLRGPTLSSSRIAPVVQAGPASLETSGRRRSSSEPQRPTIPPAAETWSTLPPVAETASYPYRSDQAHLVPAPGTDPESEAAPTTPGPAPAPIAEADVPQQRQRRRHFPGRRRLTVQGNPHGQVLDKDCYDSRIVDFLDVVDPEVAALSSITNIQNSLFVPSLGRWVNRRPTYDLSQFPQIPGAFPPSKEDVTTAAETVEKDHPPTPPRSPSLSSVLSEPQYAILPNDASLEGWPEEDIKALNDYVRHMLHSRRSKIKQRFKAFGKYAKRPLGFLVTLYATLITLFGLAWVLFLIGWIYVGDRQLYAIDVIDYVLVALFGVVGDGLAPFRAIDTYHMLFIAHYHRKTWKLRKQLLLPDLQDHNDLPTGDHDGQDGQQEQGESHRGGTRQDSPEQDLEAQNRPASTKQNEYFPVLSDKAEARLIHHQTKLAKSHTFYKPHETETHHAFPLRLLIAVVLLLDLHSCLQISLGICTWAVSAHRLPAAVTTTILCCSITTNVTAGVLISIGDRRTRKQDVLERLLKQDLTGEVMKKMKKKKEKEAEKEHAKKEGEDGVLWSNDTSFTSNLSTLPARIDKYRKSGERSRSRDGVISAPPSQSNAPRAQDDDGHLKVPGALPHEEETSRKQF
ncbi:uncharacterized protein C8A04DRAFT_32899 [Dichotomopilus funicola]|uniref:Integral membrane protein n=1 Tax=Dichotomopilus funicola TaxID=1934379 RepID=A0AAN6ZIG3_9PEZI|nr:hypothetical protein C8A04DRAFT_32899 [Dichotomopilus funicola]